jgi:hypothetical protein
MALAALVDDVLGGGVPIAVEAYDGSRSGPVDAPATIVIRSPDALRRIVTAPGELGLARAYVSGDPSSRARSGRSSSCATASPTCSSSPR